MSAAFEQTRFDAAGGSPTSHSAIRASMARHLDSISAPHAVSVYGDATDNLLAPLAIAVDAANNVYVSDFLLGAIRKFTGPHADTAFVAGGLTAPTDLAFDPVTGNLYVAEYLAANRIAVVTPAGAVSTFASAAQGVSLPFGLAVGYVPPAPLVTATSRPAAQAESRAIAAATARRHDLALESLVGAGKWTRSSLRPAS